MKYFRLLQKLYSLKWIKDDPEHHLEENVLSHSLQTFRILRKESDSKDLWIAGLFHDIGKLIDSKGHEKISIDILKSFGYNNEKVFWLINNHMKIRWFLSGRMRKWGKIQKLINHRWINELVHLRRADHSGRKPGRSIEITSDFGEYINDLLEGSDEY